MKSWALLLVGTLLGNSSLLAQNSNSFSVRVGYSYSTSTPTRTTSYAIYIPSPNPKPGFYGGLTYEHRLSGLLTSQLDLTYQQKGYVSQLMTSDTYTNTYRYLGITPMIGIKPIRNLRFFVGPQVNLLLNKSTRGGRNFEPANAKGQSLELGIAGRGNYQFGRIGITVDYFHGLTPYYKQDFYYLTNRNWQLGLTYQLSRR